MSQSESTEFITSPSVTQARQTIYNKPGVHGYKVKQVSADYVLPLIRSKEQQHALTKTRREHETMVSQDTAGGKGRVQINNQMKDN